MHRKARLVLANAIFAVALLTPATAAYAATTPPSHTGSIANVAITPPEPATKAPRGLSAAATATYVVRSGDTLSGIAGRSCGNWEALYAANQRVIGRNPNLIYPGQRLTMKCQTRPERASRSNSSSTPATTAAWVNPLPGAAVTSCFGPRWDTMHEGVDLADAAGTPIRAAAAGTVKAAGWRFGGYGISVVISHGNGIYTHYAHLSRATVRVGQRVRAGQTIGRVGSTGDSTGPHLHFEVWRGWFAQVDPAAFMRARGVRVGC